MTINIDVPEKKNMIPKITVLGVGGAGGNAINNMINLNLEGVDFIVSNTDAQALTHSKADKQIQIGEQLTKGLGAGSSPEVGGKSAEESAEEILAQIEGSNMVFITAGMGGGTGTGAAPVIAKLCREKGILTVGVVTKPFHFEGSFRMRSAESGVAEMQKYVDTLIVIPNQNLFHKATEKTTFAEAFRMIDDVLYCGIKGITDLMTMPGLINLDFADIRTITSGMGKAMMGTGEAEGEKRALTAAEAAISNPLLDNASMRGASGVLINISGGLDMTLFEADEAAQRIKDEVAPDANIIFGSTFDKDLDGKIRVSVVATGIDVSEGEKKDLNKNITSSFQERSPIQNNITPVNQVNNKVNIDIQKDNEVSQNKNFIPPVAVNPQDFIPNNTNIQNPVAQDTVQNPVQSAQKNLDNTSNVLNNTSENVVDINQINTTQENLDNLQQNQDAVENLQKIAVGSDIVPEQPQENNAASNNILTNNNLGNISGVNNIPVTSTSVDTEANNTVKTGKIAKSFGGLFSFFKESGEQDNNVSNDAPQANISAISSSEKQTSGEDLTISEDVLNVPAFLRKNKPE